MQKETFFQVITSRHPDMFLVGISMAGQKRGADLKRVSKTGSGNSLILKEIENPSFCLFSKNSLSLQVNKRFSIQ
jgi:hypothetical protein